jgi:hypothetical protein
MFRPRIYLSGYKADYLAEMSRLNKAPELKAGADHRQFSGT